MNNYDGIIETAELLEAILERFQDEADGAATLLPIHGTEEIADVTGAGDAVIAAFTTARVVGASTLEAARIANVAAGLAVMKRGTATVPSGELRAALAGSA